MNILKTFDDWKTWFEDHGHTPRYHSKNREEKSLAYRMQNCIIYIRKNPGEYDYILQEYVRIQDEFNHVCRCKQDLNETISLWVAWTNEHERIPHKLSEDSFERMLATRIGYCIFVFQKKPKEHEDKLNEYYRLLNLYSIKKTTSERISEWKIWTIEHGRLPRRTGKNLGAEERRMAENIYRIYKMMLKKPEKYAQLLAEYESIHSMYYVSKPGEIPLETFSKWKAWVLENEVLPSRYADDEEESLLSTKINYAVKVMNRTPTEYHDVLEEYQQLCERFANGKLLKKQKQRFKAYKEWIINHGRFPKNGDKSLEEKRLSEAMYKLFRVMRANTEEFAEQLQELEVLDKKYKYSQSKETLKKFNECAAWIIEHGRFPKFCSEKSENSIKNKLDRCLKIMKQFPDVYAYELQEHEDLLNVYSQKAIDIKNFNLWKELTLQNGVIPSSASDTSAERELSAKIRKLIQKYRKNPEKYENILKEYEFLCEKYSIKKLEIKDNLLVLDEWQKWCLVHERLPEETSSDEQEKLLCAKMKKCIYDMRRDPKSYKEAHKTYKSVRSMYKKKK